MMPFFLNCLNSGLYYLSINTRTANTLLNFWNVSMLGFVRKLFGIEQELH